MKKLAIYLIVLFITAILGAFYLQNRLAPVTDKFVESKAKFIGNAIINNIILDMLDDSKVEELFILDKNIEGRIISSSTNTAEMNLFKSKLHLRLNEGFANIANSNFSVPIMNIVGFDWMSGWGPSIPVRLLYNGSILADFESEFVAAGINQTKHIWYIKTQAEVWAIISGRQILCQIENRIPIAEMIVMGDVPNIWLNR